MKPRTPDDAPQDDLFCHQLDNIISLKHPLLRLPERIDWDAMNQVLSKYYEVGSEEERRPHEAGGYGLA